MILIISFRLKGIVVKTEFQINQLWEDQFWKFSFVYLYNTYYAKSLLHKYYKEGASVVIHFGTLYKKKENTKKNIFKGNPKNNSNAKRMSERLENC
jgi:hypothetical protein